jgi:hypothetical protein
MNLGLVPAPQGAFPFIGSNQTTVPMPPAPARNVFLVGSFADEALELPSTASRTLLPGIELARFVIAHTTSSGRDLRLGRDRTAAAFVHELRRLSGLTWDQLAGIFDVSRRTMHLWASGKPMTIGHETKLHRVTAFIHRIERGEARLNRAALLSVRSDGVSVLDLLLRREYEEAEKVLGRGGGRVRRALTPLSAEAREVRRPRAVADLLQTEPLATHRHPSNRLSRAVSRRLRPPK